MHHEPERITAPSGDLTHFDQQGHARMVDVGAKAITLREPIATGFVTMRPETLALIKRGAMAKGDVLGVSRIAGIQAAKRTWELIPLCHTIPLTGVDLDLEPSEVPTGVLMTARVRSVGQTGAEMEALTAVAVAGLTIYDMCKAVDRGMTVSEVRLVRKSGGKSGTWEATERQ